jgi:hypothetical protein
MKSFSPASVIPASVIRAVTVSLPSLSLSTIAACADDDEDDRRPAPTQPQPQPITCTVSISPTTVPYQLGDSGRMLVLAPGTLQEETYERLGVAQDLIYGSWLVGDELQSGVRLRFEVTFETGRMSVSGTCTARGKSVTAIASSTATITASSITIHSAASKSVEFR